MKKQVIYLIVLGSFCLSFTLLTRNFFTISVDVDDFLKGVGVAFMISALFFQRKSLV